MRSQQITELLKIHWNQLQKKELTMKWNFQMMTLVCLAVSAGTPLWGQVNIGTLEELHAIRNDLGGLLQADERHRCGRNNSVERLGRLRCLERNDRL